MAAEKEVITLSSAVISLVPVIIGGGLTIVGGLCGSLITHLLTRKSSKEDFQREMIQSVVKLAFQTNHWLEEHKNASLFDSGKIIGASPSSEIEIITKLYLPQLNKHRLLLSKAENNYNKWILRGQKELRAMKGLSVEYINEYDDIYRDLIAATSALVDRAAELLNNEKP